MAQGKNSLPIACKEFEPDLVLYYYGDCSEEDQRKIVSHLAGCASCRRFTDDLRQLLPLTEKPDDPPPAFWENYSRELRTKLAAAPEKPNWTATLRSFFSPWPVPVFATALVLLLAVTITFTRDTWRSLERPNREEVQEILPMAKNLEFFRSIDFLESLELLQSLEENRPDTGAV
jgi:hypothetical protein